MNIFIMVLVVLFMAGYYFMDSPSQRITATEQTVAIKRSDLRSVAECASAVHTAAIRGYEFDDICVEQYEIKSEIICLNERSAVAKCEIIRNKKPEFTYLVTSTGIIPDTDYNSMMEILEAHYANAGTFGIFMDDAILSGGVTGKRAVPSSIIKTAELENGQLVYLTQYEMPDSETEFAAGAGPDINCPLGTAAVYRFARWQCVSENTKTSCSGDRIWDFDLQECIADDARKPLCAARQTAVMVDDLWECIDPFLEKTCPAGMIARLNYNNLEWECIEDPNASNAVKKCAPTRGVIHGQLGATLRVSSNSCTDCEDIVTDPETCETTCVPNPNKLNDRRCYPTNVSSCSGPSRAFYFGFPSTSYAAAVSAVSEYPVPFDSSHSQNRKFNCLDCGTGRIDPDRSLPPYIAVCE